MNLKLKTSTITTFALALGLAACGGTTTSSSTEEEVLGEGAAYLSLAEDDADDPSDDGLAGTGDPSAVADEDATDLDPSVADAAEPCDFGGRRIRIKMAYDADGDGTLSEAEKDALIADLKDAKAAHPRLAKLVRRVKHHRFHVIRWAFDVDGSGDLDANERAELAAAAESRCQAIRAVVLSNFDADQSGKLEGDELVAFRRAKRAQIIDRAQDIMANYDTNGDRILDLAERQALKEGVKEKLQTRMQTAKEHFDANDDGRLDQAERDALKAEIRTRYANPPRATTGA